MASNPQFLQDSSELLRPRFHLLKNVLSFYIFPCFLEFVLLEKTFLLLQGAFLRKWEWSSQQGYDGYPLYDLSSGGSFLVLFNSRSLFCLGF